MIGVPGSGERFDGLTIVTGVPRPGDGDVYPKWKPSPKPRPLAPAPQPKPVEAEPPAPPKHWTYVWVQTRAPTERDPGAIIEGQYATAGDVLYLETTDGDPIAPQRLRRDDNAPAVARRLLKERWRGKSTVPGFYDSPSFNPTRNFSLMKTLAAIRHLSDDEWCPRNVICFW